MTSTHAVPALLSRAGDRNRAASDVTDGDDGIDIASVTRLDRSTGPVLRVLVRWLEGGRPVGRTVELPDP